MVHITAQELATRYREQADWLDTLPDGTEIICGDYVMHSYEIDLDSFCERYAGKRVYCDGDKYHFYDRGEFVSAKAKAGVKEGDAIVPTKVQKKDTGAFDSWRDDNRERLWSDYQHEVPAEPDGEDGECRPVTFEEFCERKFTYVN